MQTAAKWNIKHNKHTGQPQDFMKRRSVQRLKPRKQAWISPESARETASFHKNHPDKQRGRLVLRNINPFSVWSLENRHEYHQNHRQEHIMTLRADVHMSAFNWPSVVTWLIIRTDRHPTIESQSKISVAASFVGSKYFHATENISIQWNWTKLWKLDFPTFFYNTSKNISILWKRFNFYQCENLRKRDTCTLSIWEQAIDLCRIKHESKNSSRLGLFTDLPCTEDWTCKTVTRTDKQHMANRSFILNLF